MTVPLMLTDLPPEVVARVKQLYKEGWFLINIARKLGIRYHHVKRITDPAWYEDYKVRKVHRDREKRKSPNRTTYAIHDDKNPLYDPVRDGQVYHTNIFSQMLGDPPPGRSALDQRQRNNIIN